MCTLIDQRIKSSPRKRVYKVLSYVGGRLASRYSGKSCPRPSARRELALKMPFLQDFFYYTVGGTYEIPSSATTWMEISSGAHSGERMAMEGFHVYLSKASALSEADGHYPVAVCEVSPEDFLFAGQEEHSKAKVATYRKIRIASLVPRY